MPPDPLLESEQRFATLGTPFNGKDQAALHYKNIGRTGLKVSAVGLGCAILAVLAAPRHFSGKAKPKRRPSRSWIRPGRWASISSTLPTPMVGDAAKRISGIGSNPKARA